MGAFATTGPVQDVVIAAGSSGDNTVVAAVSGTTFRLLQLVIVAAGTCTLTIGSDLGGSFVALTGAIPLVANTPIVLPLSELGYCQTAAGKALNFKLSGTVAVAGVAQVQSV